MNLKGEKIVSITCVTIMMFFLLTIISTYIYNRYFAKLSSSKLVYNDINWQQEYPFDNEEESVLEPLTNSYLDKYMTLVNNKKNALDNIINENILFRYPLSELHSYVQKKLGISLITSSENDVIILDDGYATFRNKEINQSDIASNITDLQNYLNEKGMEYLYVMAPYKYANTTDNNTYKGYIDFTKENALNLVSELRKNKVNLLNLQETAIKQGIDPKTLIFKTDHHWKISSSLWGAKEIALELNKNFGLNIDLKLYDKEQFKIDVYEGAFLGSQGKKTTISYLKPDDFEYIIPEYDTTYHIKIPSFNIDIKGSFEETLINQENLKKEKYPAKYYKSNFYSAYGYGDISLINITNYKVSDSKKILVIKDSFGDAVVPLLSLGLHDISIIDLRHFTGSLKSYIKEYEPDIVLMIMGGSTQHTISEGYEQHTSLYDFR